MSIHESIGAPVGEATLGDVLTWAEATGQSYDAICELKKVPARLGLVDEDIGLIPADLKHYEQIVAASHYGVVSKAQDLKAARRRGNARVRALLRRFFAEGRSSRSDEARASYDLLIDAVQALEGFPDRGAEFSTCSHRSLYVLRARSARSVRDLDDEEIARICVQATTEKRKSVRKALRLLNLLIENRGRWPDIAAMLPPAPLKIPRSPDRAERIAWTSLPEGFRTDAEGVLQATLAPPSVLAAKAREMMAAGATSEEINAFVNERAKARGRAPSNHSAALSSYRGAITWLIRAQRARGGAIETLATLAELMSRDAMEAAAADQIERSLASLALKDPAKSQTLAARLQGLRTIARHGLRDPSVTAHVDVIKAAYQEYVVTPREMTEDADRICRRLRDHPRLAATFVHAPARLAALAEEARLDAVARGDLPAEDLALRLYAAAAVFAIQLSRPLRTSNLVALRHRGCATAAGQVVWPKKRRHAELRFAKGEIKNDRRVAVHVLDDDAEVLWAWLKVHRARFLELRKLADSPYVFPGSASPRHAPAGLILPEGCMSPATFAEMWALGDERLGLGFTPHQARHAVATLILALEPGNWSLVASVLADTEDTVRRHYGTDSGEAAAVRVRGSLLTSHPDLFRRMKRRRDNAARFD